MSNPLVDIMLESAQPGLFPKEVLDLWENEGPTEARKELVYHTYNGDPDLRVERKRWLQAEWLWATPVSGSAPDRTLLGTGLAFRGGRSPGPDDATEVRNRWFSVLGLPVYPTGRYWVSKNPARDLHGRLPVDRALYLVGAALPTMAVLWGILLLLPDMARFALDSAEPGELHIVNGYDRRLVVDVAGKTVEVGPSEWTAVRTDHPGAFTVTVKPRNSDEVLDSLNIDVGGAWDSSITVFNPGGRAVLARGWVAWGDYTGVLPDPVLHVGRLMEIEKARYTFEEPPTSRLVDEDGEAASQLLIAWPGASLEERLAGVFAKGTLQDSMTYEAFVADAREPMAASTP